MTTDEFDDLWDRIRDVEKLCDNFQNDILTNNTDLEQHEKRIRHIESDVIRLSSPNSASSTHTECHLPQNLVESLIRLLQAFEKHLPRENCCHVSACHYKPCTSRYSPCDSSVDTSIHPDNSSHQTSTLKESYELLLFRILEKAWEKRESLNLTCELSQVLSSLLKAPLLEYREELHEDRIHIQFRDGTHPESLHSELILHRCSHNN